MNQDAAGNVIPYERRFVPAVAWAVRGAALQLGGRMRVVEDDGTVAFEARAGTGLVFAAVILGVLAITAMVIPMVLTIWRPAGVPKPLPLWGGGIGAILLIACGVCYALAMQSLSIQLIRDLKPVGLAQRMDNTNLRWSWLVTDEHGERIGTLVPGPDGQLTIIGNVGPAGGPARTLLTVSPNFIPGLSQAAWRSLHGPHTGAKGRLRIGMGAGARLELDDEGTGIDRRLLATLLLIVAIEGK